MIPRKIQAPGVEVNEIDVSQYNGFDLTDSTVVLLNGFSDKGLDNVTKIVTSLADFVNTYGYPTTEAERYLYNGVKQTIIHGGIPAVTKMPYENNSRENYSCCKYHLSRNLTRISSVADIVDELSILAIFPSGLEYNPDLTSIAEIVENVKTISSSFEESLSSMQEIVEKLEFLDEQFDITSYSELTSTEDIVCNLYEIDKEFYTLSELSILNYSEQVRVFGEFVDGICNFNSYHLRAETLSGIDSLLYNTINCFNNIRNILIRGNLRMYDDEDTTSPEKVIYEAMSKNGYSTYENFLSDFSRSLTKDQYIASMEAIRNSPLSDTIPESQIEFIKGIKYTDLAAVDGMETYVEISSEGYPTTMSFDDYDRHLIGDITVDASNPTITIVDISRGKYEKDKLSQNDELSAREYLGIVPVLMTAPNAMWWQNLINHTHDEFSCYNIVSEINASHGLSVPKEHVEIPISAMSDGGMSIGNIAASYFPRIENFTPNTFDNTKFQKVGVVVFKMGIDTSNNNMISLTPVEAFTGTLNRKSKDLTTNSSDYLEDIVNSQSQLINLFIDISEGLLKKYMEASTFLIANQPAFSLGFSSEDCEKNISVELIKKSISLAFEHLQNPNLLKIDVVADCGMSNIAQYIDNTTLADNVGKFDIADSYSFQIRNKTSIREWKAVIDLYDDFCSNVRKDCMFIADSPRNFCLLGNQKIVRRSNPYNTIENSILPSLKFMVDFNTSYGAGYCNWFRCIDDTTRYYMWMPPTVKVIEAYLRTDNLYNFWDAPAGSRRGVMTETYDVAFNPAEKDAEKIYINRWNYAVAFPLEGILLEGQKTFQKNQTAFDRVNVRRLFIRVEKDVVRMARTFLYEPLTERNMTRFRDMVGTYLQDIQTNDGIRQFYIICDGRNNTPETIDNNELHCSIGIMPVKTLEFIVLNFICTNQSANVEEVTSQYI